MSDSEQSVLGLRVCGATLPTPSLVGNPYSGAFGTLPLPRSSVLFHELVSAVKRPQLAAGAEQVVAVSGVDAGAA